jgi:hypothetical protein
VKTIGTLVAVALAMVFAPIAFGIAALLGKAGALAALFRDAAVIVFGMVEAFKERFKILFRTWGDWPWYGKVVGLWATVPLAIGDMVGLPSIVESLTGRELMSNRSLSESERGAKGFGGSFALATTAIPVALQGRAARAAQAEARAATAADNVAAHAPDPAVVPEPAVTAPEPAAAPSAQTASEVAARAEQQVLLQGADAEIAEFAARVKPKPGVLDVFVHGAVDDFIVFGPGGERIVLNHRSLALYLKKSGKPYNRIRLIACETGKHARGAAQHLANKLDVDSIEAPTDKVHIMEDGSLVVGPTPEVPSGAWEEIVPKKSAFRYTLAKETPPPTVWERLARRREARAAEAAGATPETAAPTEPGPASPSKAKTMGNDPWDESLFDDYGKDASYVDEAAEWRGEEPTPDSSLPRGLQDDRVSPRSGQQPHNPSADRPSWQDSEARVSDDLGHEFEDQRSFRGGKEVAHGEAGSVRPDNYSGQHKMAVDVKNYDLTTPEGRQRLVKIVVSQAEERGVHLPPGTRQGFVLEVRGQIVSETVLESLRQRILARTQGLVLNPDDIVFITE